jgi:hypothetical protein
MRALGATAERERSGVQYSRASRSVVRARRSASATLILVGALVLLMGWVQTSAAHAEASLSGAVSYPDGSPAAGVEVDVDPASPTPGQSYPTRQAITDPDGHWTFSPLPAGSYQILYEVVLGTGGNETEAVEQVVLGEDQQASTTTTLSGPEGPGVATLTGTVLSATGLPAGGATLSFSSASGGTPLPGSSSSVNANGTFTVLLPAGSYGLAISRDFSGSFSEADNAGPESLTTNIDIPAGETTTVSYTLPPPTPLAIPAGISASRTAQDLEYLNAERARWGLPAGVTANSTWSQACAAHDAYLADNNLLEHPENESLPGYSPGGNWAGTHSILAEGGNWTAQANPWEDAPIHLDQLYTADLYTVGIDESRGYSCTTTWPGIGPPASPVGTVITYPGNGTSGLPPAEDAAELPFVPGNFVGVPAGTVAGRELFVYEEQSPLMGPCSGFCLARAPTITSASLTSVSGAAEVKWVDGSTNEVGGYLTGAIIIPVKPLAANTTYKAGVTLEANLLYGVAEVAHEWTFTTGPPNPSGLWPWSSYYGSNNTASPRSLLRPRPLLTQLRLLPPSFRAAAHGATISTGHTGSTVSYTDTMAATTTFYVLRRLSGIVRGSSCVARSRGHRKGKTCSRYVRIYSFSRRDRAGANHFHFSGRVSRVSLAVGAYELRAAASLAGATGPSAGAPFRIVK